MPPAKSRSVAPVDGPRREPAAAPPAIKPSPAEDLWVFGYGSLMWRPGFAFVSSCKATLRGWRRSFCIYSHVYRGTPEKPGLVLGLDRGGACAGVAFRVKASLREPTIRYLREREQTTSVYIERTVPVTLETGERVAALVYTADRLHEQYAGRLDRQTMLALIRRSRGQTGDNATYVTETHAHLADIGVRDSELEWLVAELKSRGASAA